MHFCSNSEENNFNDIKKKLTDFKDTLEILQRKDWEDSFFHFVAMLFTMLKQNKKQKKSNVQKWRQIEKRISRWFFLQVICYQEVFLRKLVFNLKQLLFGVLKPAKEVSLLNLLLNADKKEVTVT